jgi:serine protease Do
MAARNAHFWTLGAVFAGALAGCGHYVSDHQQPHLSAPAVRKIQTSRASQQAVARHDRPTLKLIAAPATMIAARQSPPATRSVDKAELQQSVKQSVKVEAAPAISDMFRAAAQRILPSVVMVHQVVRAHGRKPEKEVPGEIEAFNPTHPLLRSFRQQADDSPGENGEGNVWGSGVIIDRSGVVLTNGHVIAADGPIIVQLHDGRHFKAVDVKIDRRSDLAIIRIAKAGPLVAATLADSSKLQAGDWVLAIGNPFGLSGTITAGIVGAKDRGLGITQHDEFLQTDAAINPGNSGGPLVNLRGEVVGINTAISSTSGGYEGIGFAIPSNVARWVGSELIAKGRVDRSFLGVGIQRLTPDLAEQLGVLSSGGALIASVQPDAPAAQAGVRSGDVVISYAGHEVASPQQLLDRVEGSPIGSQQKLTVARGRGIASLTVTLRRQPEDEEQKLTTMRFDAPRAVAYRDFGLRVAALPHALATALESRGAAGVMVESVESGSPAETAGVGPGMIISNIGRMPVKDMETYRAAVNTAAPSQNVLVLVHSTEGSAYLVVKMD